MVLIIISVVSMVVEVATDAPPSSIWARTGNAITWVFVVELSLRFWVAKKKSRFFRRYWPDLLAVLPVLRPLRLFWFLRLLRLLRLFQLGMILDRRVALLSGLLRLSFYFLWVLLVLTGILVVGGAVIAFLLEQSGGGDFATLEKSLWWAAYALVAGEPVGSVPATTLGRVVLAGLMLAGTALFAVFTGLVSATMMDRLKTMSQLGDLDLDELEGHLVVCGWNQGAKPLLAELAVDPTFAGIPIVLVNELEAPPDLAEVGIRAELVYHLQGDFTALELLRKAGVPNAARAVVLADDSERHTRQDRDARSVLCALTIERMQPDIYCVVELMNAANRAHLEVGGVEAVIMRNDLSGRALASACRHPRLATVMMDLFTLRTGVRLGRVPGPAEPLSFAALQARCKAELGYTVFGVERPSGELFINPGSDHLVNPEDHLVVVEGGAHIRSERD